MLFSSLRVYPKKIWSRVLNMERQKYIIAAAVTVLAIAWGGYTVYKAANNRVDVRITPSAGTVVRAGEIIQINIEAVGGSVVGILLKVGLASEGLGSAKFKHEALEGSGPFSVPFKIQKNFIGKLYISAEAFVAEKESYIGKTFVMVQPIAPIVSIAIPSWNVGWNELTLKINSRLKSGGVWYPLSVSAQLANGDEIDVTSNRAGTSYSLLRPSRVVSRLVPSGLVAPVVASDIIAVSQGGIVEALGVGQDTVLISNSGKSTAVIVTVKPFE